MAFLRNPVVYVPDLTNGRPIVDGKVYVLVAGTVPPTHDSAINPATLVTVSYKNEAGNIVNAPQPLYTSKGGCLYGEFPEEARQYISAQNSFVFAVYDKIGRLQYSSETSGSDYVETADLAAVNSTVLVGGVEAGKAGAYLKRVFVEHYGAVGNGTTDDAAAFLAMHNAVGFVSLSQGKEYFVTSLPNLATVRIIGNGAKINYDRLLIDRAFTILDIDNVNFDARGSNLTRCIRVRANSKIKFRRVNGYNINSATFVRMFDISTESVDIDLEDMYCENLVAAENGTVGDNNGACRFIYVGDEGGALTKTSFGRIVNIRGNTLMPKEDGDMIHIQSSDSKRFAIELRDISGVNIAKRVVKIQANGVDIDGVTCDAVNNAVSMYAVVSHYGEFGSVSNVFGVGKLEQGVDTQYESTQVSEVNCQNTGTAVSQGACLKGSGGLFGRNITGHGFEHVVGNYISLVSNANTDVEGVYGQATGIPVFIRASLVSGRVNLEGVKASTSGNFRLVQITRTSSNTFTYVDIEDVAGDCNTFTAVDVTGSPITEMTNININQTASGIPVAVNGGEAYLTDVAGRGTCTDAVFLNTTTKAVVTRARGGASAQVITTGCNNTIVNNAICNAGVPASRNSGAASTNTQNIGTLTFA